MLILAVPAGRQNDWYTFGVGVCYSKYVIAILYVILFILIESILYKDVNCCIPLTLLINSKARVFRWS